MDQYLYPNEATFIQQRDAGDRWEPLPLMEEIKQQARAEGLWNLFLPESEYGAGLTNYEYAPLCEIMADPPGRRKYSTARRPIRAIWKPSSTMVTKSRKSGGSSLCWRGRSVPPFG